MNDGTPNPPQRKSYIVTYIVVFFILSTIGIIINIINIQNRDRGNVTGDGLHVDTYGFDFTTCLVDQDFIVASGIPKDGHEIVDFPEFIPAAEVDVIKEEIRGKYQVSGDKVIGVNINGDVRAYPIRILQWHEVINDVVGDVPIAVTYSPLSDSVVVIDRRIGDETLEFGVSGLLFNSTLLLYDRRENAADESLWSQLQMRAVSGKAAEQGLHFETLPCSLSRWDDWKEQYPDTVIFKPNLKIIRQYQGDPFGPYHSMDRLNFAVNPAPPVDVYQNKTHMIILNINQEMFPIPLPVIQAYAGDNHLWDAEIGGQSIQFKYTPVPEMARVVNDPSTLPGDFSVMYAYHFAWYSHQPSFVYLQ